MRRKGTRLRILTWALTALLTAVAPDRFAPAHAREVPIGNGGLDGFIGDGALRQSDETGNENRGNGGGESKQAGNGGNDGDAGSGGISAGNSRSGANRGTGGADTPGGSLQALVPRQPSTVSGNLAGITSSLTFPSFNPPGTADGWNANPDLVACALIIERTTHVGPEMYSLSLHQPTLPQCSDTLSLNFAWVRDRLAVRLKAPAAGPIDGLVPGLSGSANGATSSLSLALEYTPSERFSWTIESLMSGTQMSTQTTLLYSPSADWYMRLSLSGSSLGVGTSFTTQLVEVGYQGDSGPHASLKLGRQLSGIAEYDTTTFALSTSLQGVSTQFEYSVSTMIATTGEASAVQTSHYPDLKFAFPMLGWSWTVSGTMTDGSNVIVGLSMERDNLSVDLTPNPLGFRVSYSAKF